MTDFGYPWTPDLGDGTYRNPVLYADYSDPDAIRDGDDYWMTASSFNCTPGLPILHSRDLVNWTLVNHAIRQLPDPRGVYHTVQSGCGMWAPAIRKHAGRFWIFFPMPDEGIYVTTATDPAGEWSTPHLLQAGLGLIDPCPLWDDDGKAYLVFAYARSRAGIKNKLRVAPMAPDASRLLGEGQIVFDEPERHPTCEGPKFMKRDGYYYIAAPAGGVATGWQLVLRSKNIYGPYEEKIVLEQGKSPINGPHQGAYVDSPDGQWWFLHFQDDGIYGRIVHLQPVTWKDGWPLTGIDADGNGIGEPVLRHTKPPGTSAICTPPTSDEFDSGSIGLQWQWHANHEPGWASLHARPGWLRLSALPAADDLGKSPNLLLQKFPARSFSIETHVELNAARNIEAGLVVAGHKHAAMLIHASNATTEIRLIVNNEVVTAQAIAGRSARLRVNVADGGLCSFSYVTGDSAQPVDLPVRFQATEGHWIGAKVGLLCHSLRDSSHDAAGQDGFADVEYFRLASAAIR